MPSGAKKRKAARKKKQKGNNTNNPQGNEDLKSIDEKGSDDGEGDSPAHHHEHDDHHNPFNDGSEEPEERGPSASQLHASDVESSEEVSSDVKIDQVLRGKDNVILVERVLKSEECCESANVSSEQIEIAKESFYENGNGGDTSKGEFLTEKNTQDGNSNSVEEAIVSRELVKSIDSSPSKMTSITEMALVEGTVNSAADSLVSSIKALAPVSEVEKSDTGSVLLEKSVVHPVEVTNLDMKNNEDNVYPLTDENVTSSVEEPKPKEYDSEVLASLPASPVNKFTNGAKDPETAEQSENQPHVALAPNVVQKTSWLSCCGLFEVLSSSNR